MGISCPKLRGAISFLLKLLKLTGIFEVTRIAETKTSSRGLTLMESFGFSCEKERKDQRKKRIEHRRIDKRLEFFVFVTCALHFVLFK
jgi:hypothetical protein